MIWLVFLVLVQVIIAIIVVIVLKNILDNMLADMAVRDFDYWHADEESTTILSVNARVYKSIKPAVQERIVKSAKRKFGENVKVVFLTDKSILGGIIIEAGKKRFDYTLQDRLKRALSGQG